jgi:hypothetical protein
MEDPRDDAAGLLLERLGDSALRCEAGAEFWRHDEYPALKILGRARMEPDDPRLKST